jgi:membrane protein
MQLSRLGRSDLALAARGAAGAYGRHATSQLAAAIAYRMLFSIVPLVALFATIVHLVLPHSPREAVGDWLAKLVPGTSFDSTVERALTGATVSPTVAGLVALVTLLWAASGMMAAIRTSFRIIWDTDRGRPYVRAKLLDFALVAGTGIFAVAAFAATLLTQVVAQLGNGFARLLESTTGGRVLGAIAQILASVAVTFLIFGLLYRVVPPRRPSYRALWRPALVAAVAFHIATAGYAFYLDRFGDVATVYGPLGAVLGFLLVVYVGVIVLLLGAELVAAWPEAGDRDNSSRG